MRLDLIRECIPPTWRLTPLTMEVMDRVWKKVGATKDSWARTVYPNREVLQEVLSEAVLLFETPWGILYVDEYEVGWKCNVHALIWSKDVFKELKELRHLVDTLLEALFVKRVQCPVLGDAEGVKHLLRKLGFEEEGTLKEGGRTRKGTVMDKTLFSVLHS